MALAELHQAVISKLTLLLPDWKFVKSSRSFTKSVGTCKWSLHLSFINHVNDFDVVADVAVEHLNGRTRICILGAELGNIIGTGQHRWPVENMTQADKAALGVRELLETVGMPLLNRFTSIDEVIHVLRTDKVTSRLIFPLVSDTAKEATEIEARVQR